MSKKKEFNPYLNCPLCGRMRNFQDAGTIPIVIRKTQMVRLASCGTCHNYAMTLSPEAIKQFKYNVGLSLQTLNCLNAYLWFREAHPQRLKNAKGSEEELAHMIQLSWSDQASFDRVWFTLRGIKRFTRIAQPELEDQVLLDLVAKIGVEPLQNYAGTMH